MKGELRIENGPRGQGLLRSPFSIRHSPAAAAQVVLRALEYAGAQSTATALPDREISRRTGLPQRDIIDLAEALAEMDIAVLASCGDSRGGRARKGRYIERDPAKVRDYGERLQKRAAQIHQRAWNYIRLAERMEARRKVETNGQGRMFPE